MPEADDIQKMSESLLSLLLSIKGVLVERPGDDELLDQITGHPGFVSQTKELWERLAAEQAIRIPLLERQPFVTINVGNFASVPDLKQALTDGGYCIGDWADNLMGRPAFSLLTEPGTLDLYRSSNAELGYPNGCTVKESVEALEKIGAKKLPPEAGPQFRLQYPGQQPLGERCLMYMDTIAVSGGSPGVFCVEHGGPGLWLYSSYAGPEFSCNADEVWVFAR